MVKHRISIQEIYRRDHGICGICLEPVRIEEATREHIIPRNMGGTENLSNLMLTHETCNTDRMDKELLLKPALVKFLDPMDVDDYERRLLPAWQLRKKLKRV